MMHTILTYLNDFEMENEKRDFEINEEINQSFVALIHMSLQSISKK